MPLDEFGLETGDPLSDLELQNPLGGGALRDRDGTGLRDRGGTGLRDPDGGALSRIRPPAFATLARVGVWGMLTGICGAFTSLFGAGAPGTAVWWLGGVGTLAGGLGISAASFLILRKFRWIDWKARAGALVGVPFGLAAAMTAAGWLGQGIASWIPGAGWLYGIMNFSAGAMALLGLVLGVLVGTGILGYLKEQFQRDDFGS